MLTFLIPAMLLAGLVFPLATTPPACFVAFLAVSVLTFFNGKSRRVVDPIFGIQNPTVLSPVTFDSWATEVCSSDGYQAAYYEYVTDENCGVDQKLHLMFSQITAINYFHALKVLMFLLGILLAFDIY